MKDRNNIITLPHPNLRKPSKKVLHINEEIHSLIEDMKNATLDWEDSRDHEVGVALAAIQINELYRVVVIRNNFDNKLDRTFSVLINPEITKYEGEVEQDYEGCLSVKDLYGYVPRHTKVRVQALNEKGAVVKFKADGFMARVLQHEIDHTKGKLFIDHIEDVYDAFYRLNEEGKLEAIDYENVTARNIFR